MSARELLRILKRLRCEFDRQARGSHEIWRCGDCTASIPVHSKDLGFGLLRSIQKAYEPCPGKGMVEVMRSRRTYTVSYERTSEGYGAWVAPRRGMVATTIGRTLAEARRNIRMSLADLLDCGDNDFDLRDADTRIAAHAR